MILLLLLSIDGAIADASEVTRRNKEFHTFPHHDSSDDAGLVQRSSWSTHTAEAPTNVEGGWDDYYDHEGWDDYYDQRCRRPRSVFGSSSAPLAGSKPSRSEVEALEDHDV